MPEITFAIPSGIYHTGTERGSAGRWYRGNLCRWVGGILRPIYGWSAHSTSAVTGSPRSIVAWKDNDASSFIAVGTHSNLYVMNRSGTLYDITPAGLVTGRTDASFGTGYGGGNYGDGTYGTPRPDTTSILDATVWTLDTFGQNLMGVNPDDTVIYQWVAPTTASIAAPLTNAPSASSLVVTAERFLFALGAGGDPRSVAWCDQEAPTVWTAATTNQAGDFPLQTFGRIMCGKRLSGATGIWTDVDMWIAQYLGGTLVYSFQKAGNGCGAVSRQAVAVSNAQAAWMGPNGFWAYDGFVKALDCDVQDYVFGDINRTQISKVTAVLNSQYGEVWWFYPSGGSNENDRAVVWNYNTDHWMTHSFARTCGADAGGAFTFPLMVSPTDNLIYEHETGFSYGGAMPYVESGPLETNELADGTGANAKMWQANTFIPDEFLEGDMTATFTTRIYPNGTETVFGPYTLLDKTDVRFSGRQVKVKLTAANSDDFRFGQGRLLVRGAGNR